MLRIYCLSSEDRKVHDSVNPHQLNVSIVLLSFKNVKVLGRNAIFILYMRVGAYIIAHIFSCL